MELPALQEIFQFWGQPRYRAGQVYTWLHRMGASSFDEMSNLPVTLRRFLAGNCYINQIKVEKKLVSKVDGTVKYLYGLRDGSCVESVLMQYHHGASLCISTQVGCRMGCTFCASTLGGLKRSLTASEMLDQVYASSADAKCRIASVVLMGIGEPLDNLDNVLPFLRILSSPEGLNLSLRHVSLSTCGLVDGIRRLAEENLPLTLSVSLHAPNNTLRAQTMPVNNRWGIEELLAACRDYFAKTHRRVSFEYALIDGVNDTRDCGMQLAELLRGMNAHLNLIPVNAIPEREYRRGGRDSIRRFAQLLSDRGVTTTVRRELGADIRAACGQLRRGG